MVESHPAFLAGKAVRFCPQFSQSTPGKRGILGFQGPLDLLAPDLEKCEIRPVSISIPAFRHLGESLSACHGGSNSTGLRNRVTSQFCRDTKPSRKWLTFR
jgi:hypothetical protein